MAGKGTFTSVLADLEKDPTNVDLLFDVAERYYARAKFDEAIDHYEEVIKYDPQNEKGKADQAIHSLALTYLKDKKYEEAVTQFQRLIDTFPKSKLVPDAYSYKGYAYQKWGKKDEAIAAYESFIQAFPNDEEVDWAKEQIAKLKGVK